MNKDISMVDRRHFIAWTGMLAGAAALSPAWALSPVKPTPWPVPPQPARIPMQVGRFGHVRTDDYLWLRPKDWHAVLRDPSSLDTGIRAAIDAENGYVDAMSAPAQPLREQLIADMARIGGGKQAPIEVRDGEYLYYTREQAGSDHPVHARRPVAGGAEQVLLDVGAESAGHAYYALHWSGSQHSGDGRFQAWAADTTGSGIFSIRMREIDSGRIVVGDIENSHGPFTLSPDGRYLYWVGRNDTGRPSMVFRRDVAAGSDTPIYEETDPAFFLSLRTTASGRYVVLRIMNGEMAEVRLVPMSAPTSTPILVEPRRVGHTYDVDDWNERLLVLTDADGAVDYKLMTARIEAPGQAHWQPLLAHVPGRFITAVHPFAGHLVREEWRDANPRLVLMSADGREQEIAFEDPAYALSVPPRQGWRSPTLAFTLQTPRTPAATQWLSLADGAVRPAAPASAAVAGGHDPDRYDVRRLWARADDGEEIPVTVLMRKGAVLDGSAPLFLYGYGSYGVNVEANFSPAAIALVDQGWIHAIAHVRGGAEKGTRWWRSVLKHGKKTTFTDFIACAEHLVEQRYTRKARIVAHGLSAGGLLMGAIYTMRPDLWAGVIAQVPFVDVLTTMEEYQIHPLGTTSFPFWGDPRVPEDHAYMASYSPYDQLRSAAYPALLALGSVADERVAFWEPLKFAIKARALTTAANPIMARITMTGGHMGDSGSTAAREQDARLLAFAIWAADRRWGDVPQR